MYRRLVFQLSRWAERLGLVPSVPPAPLLALPEPLSSRAARAQKAFGIRVFDADGIAEVYSRGRQPLMRVGVSDTPPDLHRALATGTPFLTFASFAHRVKTAPFRTALRSARRQLPGNETFNAVLDGIEDWASPQPGTPFITRRGVISAPSEMVTEDIGSSALGDAEVATFEAYGDLLSEVLHRRQNGVIRSGHPLVGVVSSLEFADDHLRVDGQYQAIFAFVPRGIEELSEVLRLDVDLLAHLENVGGRLYATILLRAGGPDLASLAETGRALQAFGSVRRIYGVELNGFGLEKAFRSFLPGGPAPSGDVFGVDDTEGFLEVLAGGIDMAALVTGDTFIGASGGKPVFISRRARPCGAVVGVSNSGKTTVASALALQNPDGPNVLTVHFTSTPGEAPPLWARSLGGQCLDLNLPVPSSAEALREVIASDDWAARYWKVMSRQWLQSGYPLGMPITLRLSGGSPVRFVAVALSFLRGFFEAWRALHEQTGVRGVLIADDVVGIGGLEDDPVLGDLPRLTGSQMRELLQQVADAGRKAGLTVIVTAHSVQEFRSWPNGFWESLAFGMLLAPEGQFSQARLIEPSSCPLDGVDGTSHGVLVDRLDVRLPRPVIEVLGRRFDLPEHGA